MRTYQEVCEAITAGREVWIDGERWLRGSHFSRLDWVQSRNITIDGTPARLQYGFIEQENYPILYDIPTLTRAKQLIAGWIRARGVSGEDAYDAGYALAVLEHVMGTSHRKNGKESGHDA